MRFSAQIVLAALSFSFLCVAQECRITQLTPSVPPPRTEEGEPALESETFALLRIAVSPENVVHFVDIVGRIRRVDENGRVRTVAGSGKSGPILPGPALETPLEEITYLAFSPSGVLHFAAGGRIYRVHDSVIVPVAGSGRPGFNGDSAPALELNLGKVVHFAFDRAGTLYIVDSFHRVRRLDGNGVVQTIAGCSRPSANGSPNGDGGPAVEASLYAPRQVVPLPDGRLWILDAQGTQLRAVAPDGTITTLGRWLMPLISLMPDGTPVTLLGGKVLAIDSTGYLTGTSPFPGVSGTVQAIGPDGSLYVAVASGSKQISLIRIRNGAETHIVAAPVTMKPEGLAPAFGVWLERSNSFVYQGEMNGSSGLIEARPGQPLRFIAGGGQDPGDPDNKPATSLSFGRTFFNVDADGRLIVADTKRWRILIIDTAGMVSSLRDQAGQPVRFTLLAMPRTCRESQPTLMAISIGGT